MMRDVTPSSRRSVWKRRFFVVALALVLGVVTGLLSAFPAAILHGYLGAADPWHAAKVGIPGGIAVTTMFWAILLWKLSRKIT